MGRIRRAQKPESVLQDFQNTIAMDVFTTLGVFFRIAKITSCFRERARFSRPISCATSNGSGTDFS